MTGPSETFDLPPELRSRANEITGKYRMALATQMAEELVDAGVPMNLAFQITVGELAVGAARIAMMACLGLEKREPRRDLWMKRAEENFDDAREWFSNLMAEGGISDPTADEYIDDATAHADILHGEGVARPLGVLASIPAPLQMDVPNFGHFIEKSREVLTSIGKTMTDTPHQTNSVGKEPPLDWGNFEGAKRNVEWKPDDQDLIYTALNYRDDEYGDQDEDAGQQIVERLLAAWRSSVISEQLTFEISARLLKERDEARAALAATATEGSDRG
ncbi:hypothetical protein [Sinorhizobium meliloti]|uniref:hypothetical protein n=2 Tax=Rhizobium meliloti TaxID=382 RepID=UPI0002DDC390|nr:hypothetical protein [Sinorhizobium meliloti]MQU93815.1 hypothetical protein [Sinorhizobium meliloti]